MCCLPFIRRELDPWDQANPKNMCYQYQRTNQCRYKRTLLWIVLYYVTFGLYKYYLYKIILVYINKYYLYKPKFYLLKIYIFIHIILSNKMILLLIFIYLKWQKHILSKLNYSLWYKNWINASKSNIKQQKINNYERFQAVEKNSCPSPVLVLCHASEMCLFFVSAKNKHVVTKSKIAQNDRSFLFITNILFFTVIR